MARFLKDKQKSKGAAPGSLIFIGRQKMDYSCIRVTQYNAEYVKEGEVKALDKISEYLSDDHVAWISVRGLQDTNLKSLNFNRELRKVQIDQISLIVGKNYLISIQETDNEYFEDVSKRIYAGQGKIRSLSSDYLCYAMIDTLVDNYILNIEKLGNVIEEQEKLLLTSGKELVENIYHYKTELSYVRNNVRPVKELMTRFVTCDSDLINDHTYNYLRDLEGLVTQALEAIEIYYTMLSDQQNSYNATISNNVNDIMKVLTIFSAIFIPLTFIVGVYGMNFDYIPFLRYRYAYFILWGIMIAIVILMLFFFKRKRWF